MKKFIYKICFCFTIAIFLLSSTVIFAQGIANFQYLDPLPNSSYNSIYTYIIIRQGDLLNKASINNDLVEAIGSKSGVHKGKIILANDSRTLIFKPTSPFQYNEEVTVTLSDGLETINGIDAGKLEFNFHTEIAPVNAVWENIANSLYKTESYQINQRTASTIRKLSSVEIPDTILPADLPIVSVDTFSTPGQGYYFLPATPYLLIVDNQGTPVFYRNTGANNQIFDFDLQPNGELTYFTWEWNLFGLDSSYNLIHTYCTDEDSGTTANGFHVDIHEMKVLPNGNYFLFATKNVYWDLTQYGGYPNSTIIDGALQEFDSSGNLLLNWVASDHYQLTDLDSNDANTNHYNTVQDFPHFNSVDFDTDGNLLISARNMDEITKINPNTGDIIWRWGGKNNQFQFINDNLGFSRQHDIRHFSNGDFSLFDNGTYHPTQLSSAVEYKLDEINKTATLVYRIYHDNIFTDTEGSVQELSNGNRLIAWGHSYAPLSSEVTTKGESVADLNYQYYVDTYRAFKYKWETNYFKTNTDSLNFGYVPLGSSLIRQFTVYNPHDTAETINQFYCSDSSFTTNISLPVIIPAKDSIVVPVTFQPNKQGNFNVTFNVRFIGKYEDQPEMIARQVILTGTTEETSSVNPGINVPQSFLLSQNYPNPFNPSTIIEYSIPKESHVKIDVFNSLGQKVTTLVDANQNSGNYQVTWNANRFASGVYFYSIKAEDNLGNNFFSVKKMILMK